MYYKIVQLTLKDKKTVYKLRCGMKGPNDCENLVEEPSWLQCSVYGGYF